MKLFSTTYREHATNEAWLRTWVIVAILLALCGCKSDCAPSFAKATQAQRESGMFIWDNSGDYEASEQYQRNIQEDYELHVRLREQLKRNSELER